MRKVILVVLILTGVKETAHAQESQKEGKEFRNTIHFNLTNPFIFGGRALVFGYERVLDKKHSFSVNFGLTEFPFDLINRDSLQANKVLDSRGFNISGDYQKMCVCRKEAHKKIFEPPLLSSS